MILNYFCNLAHWRSVQGDLSLPVAHDDTKSSSEKHRQQRRLRIGASGATAGFSWNGGISFHNFGKHSQSPASEILKEMFDIRPPLIARGNSCNVMRQSYQGVLIPIRW